MKPKCSVIVAVFNSEAFIKKCLHSLFSQTLDDIEYIFVDDASEDNSIVIINKILEQYPERKGHTKIIKLDSHQGISEVRKTGILNSTGEFIIHCDSDDYPEKEMYEAMYNEAKKTNSDIVACNYFLHQEGESHIVSKKYGATPNDCLYIINRKENCLTGTLWDKMVRSELIKKYNIVPYAGIDYTEDLNCVIRILYYAQSISVISKPLYHHIKREGSLTMNPDFQKYWRHRKFSLDKICEFINETKNKDLKLISEWWKFDFKFEYCPLFERDFKDWYELYKESHRYIFSYKNINMKGRLLLWLILQNKFTASLYFHKINMNSTKS